MNKKIFENSHFTPKGDYEVNWNKAVGYIPLDKEIIIYKKDETHSAARFKVGDGKTVVQDLPFSGTDIEAIEKLIDEKGELLIEYVDNAVAAPDWNQNDSLAKNYIKNRPFYEDKLVLVEWDGNIEGREYIFMDDGAFYLVKVNDSIYTKEELSHDIVIGVSVDGDNYAIPISELIVEEIPGALVLDGAVLIFFVSSYEICAQETGMPFTSNGTYFLKDNVGYISDLSRIDFKQIDEKFLPDTSAKKADIDDLKSNIEHNIDNIEDNINVLELEIKNIELNSDKSVATFNITEAGTKVGLLLGITSGKWIDWGDGTIDTLNRHTYMEPGEYECKFYGGDYLQRVWLVDEADNTLTKLKISNSITYIDDYAFAECYSLTDVEIGNKVESIGEHAFNRCKSLTNVIIPDSVMTIGVSIFAYCDNLSTVVIGSGVTSMGATVFFECINLTDVTFKNPVPITYNTEFPWFYHCSALTHIYVPYGCSEAYKTKWAADGAKQDILDKIVESDREAMMSDYANYADSGLVRGNGGNQFRYFFQNGLLYLQGATDIQIENRQTYVGLTADNIDKTVKAGITTNTETWTDEDKTKACETIGAVKKDTEQQTSSNIIAPLVYTNDTNIKHFLATHNKLYNVYNIPMLFGGTAGKDAVNGHLLTAIPVNNYHAANKKYVDDGFVPKQIPEFDAGATRGYAYVIEQEKNAETGEYEQFQKVKKIQIQANADTIPLRNGTGNFYVGTPTLAYECANKSYVDDNKGTKLYKHSLKIPIENGLKDLSPYAKLVYYSTSSEPNYNSEAPVDARLPKVMGDGIYPCIKDDSAGVNQPILGIGATNIIRIDNSTGAILNEAITALGDDVVTEL